MSKKFDKREPWKVLDNYRGTFFNSEWPTLPQLFKITANRYPNNLCFKQFVPENLEFTYKEALIKIEILAKNLIANGIKKGDKVALCGKNSVEWAMTYLAITFANAIVVPLDVMLTSKEIENLLNFSECKILVADNDILRKVRVTGLTVFAPHQDTYCTLK